MTATGSARAGDEHQGKWPDLLVAARSDGAAPQNTPEEIDALGVEGVEKVVATVDKKLQNACSFTISFEDHTMGNLLWAQLLEDPDVLFAGE